MKTTIPTFEIFAVDRKGQPASLPLPKDDYLKSLIKIRAIVSGERFEARPSKQPTRAATMVGGVDNAQLAVENRA